MSELDRVRELAGLEEKINEGTDERLIRQFHGKSAALQKQLRIVMDTEIPELLDLIGQDPMQKVRKDLLIAIGSLEKLDKILKKL